MKICAHCTTRNRDEVIFCSHCRRPLQGSRIPADRSLLWFLAVVILIGLGLYLFLSWSSLPSEQVALASGATPTPGPPPPLSGGHEALYTCVDQETKIRRGPSTQSETIGGLPSGTCLRVLGRTEDSSWVYMVSNNHQTGWVSSELLSDTRNIDKVSIRDDSALANAARPTLTSAEIAHGAQSYLTMVAATNVVEAPLSSYTAPCFDAARHVGGFVSCKLERAYCDYLPDLEGSPTFCNDRPHPDHNFALIVFGKDWSEYDGQCIIVSGYLEIDRGVLKIQALEHSQVSACD